MYDRAKNVPQLPKTGLKYRVETLIGLTGLKMAKYRMYFSSAKAEAELGYRARPYREALADAIAWFRQAGYLR